MIKTSRFPSKVTDSASLTEVGNAIAVDFGITAKIYWVFTAYEETPIVRGGCIKYCAEYLERVSTDFEYEIRVSVGKGSMIAPMDDPYRHVKRGDVITPSQSHIKQLIVHELGHIVKPPVGDEAHHPDFWSWVDEHASKLVGTT